MSYCKEGLFLDLNTMNVYNNEKPSNENKTSQWYDLSPYKHIGKVTNCDYNEQNGWYADFGQYNKNVFYTNKKALVEFGDLNNYAYCIELLFYNDSNITNDGWGGILRLIGGYGGVRIRESSGVMNGESLCIMSSDSDGYCNDRTYITDTIETGWHHLIINNVHGQNYFYIDGKNIETKSYDKNNQPVLLAKNVIVGYDGGGFDGSIGIVRLYSNSLSEKQIQDNYNYSKSWLKYGTDSKIIIKQENHFYTINDNNEIEKLNIEMINKDIFINKGFNNFNNIFKNIDSESERIKLIDKICKITNGKFDILVKELE